MEITETRAYASLVSIEVIVETGNGWWEYRGEWEFGKEHYFDIYDSNGNALDSRDSLYDDIHQEAKSYVMDNFDKITNKITID